MPRSSLFRALAAAALVALAAGTSATAQDADAVAKKATAELKAIQEQLAAGKGADGDAPVLKQLRIDGFAADGDKLAVTGVFLDAGGKGAADERFGDAAKQVVVKQLKLDKAPPFNWEKVEVFGVPDAGGKVEAGRESPFVALQAAANAASVDGVFLTGNRFGPAGELVLVGSWARDAQKALTDLWTAGALAKHPAAWRKKGDKPSVSFGDVKVFDAWPLSAAAARAALAESRDPALRRTRIDRLYFQYADNLPKLIIAGVRIGEDKMTEGAVKAAVEPLWADVVSKIPAAPAAEILNDLPDPAADVQAAVAEVRALDGIRVDVGAEFDKDGNVLLAGLKPDTGDKKVVLTDVFKAVVGKKAGGTGATAPRYALLATSKVSTDAMRPLPLSGLLDDLRAWAKANKDDVRFRRLAFAATPAPFDKQYYSVAKDGGGLTLVYQAAADADLKATAAEFQRLFAKRFPKGLPETKAAATGTKGDEPPAKDGAKEPLLPGLTDALRAMVAAARDLPQADNPWFGVLLTRGYFDERDQYRLIGVVDTEAQNAALLKQLEAMKAEPKWAAYFRDADGKELALVPPKLDVISMSALLDRVKRVTPAYPDFDGVRIDSAYYDEKLYLTFKAHAVGKVTPDVVGKLADLLVGDPKYSARVARPEQPADPTTPRLPPKVRIKPLSGPAYPDDQVANFSLAYGGQLLAEAESGKEAKAKAKQWLDVALLHYPNESAVWFLSARYNLQNADESKDARMELVRRDLYRVIDLEGPLAFNGPAQRKRRYEAAKDFQGKARTDLEALWLEALREVKDGGKPITLAGK